LANGKEKKWECADKYLRIAELMGQSVLMFMVTVKL